MDIYDYLKMDHKKVANLFELFESAQTAKNKLEIIALIKKELIIHADSESNTFYKALERHRKSEDEAFHGEDEHVEIKSKINEIALLKSSSEMMAKKVLELKELVEHHVSDEEGKIFNAAKEVLSDAEALSLKEQMHDYKEKMLNTAKVDEEEVVA